MNNSKWYLSTWFIVVMFIVFWPVGIALLIMRNQGNKNALVIGSTNKKTYVIAGVAFLILGIMAADDNTFWGILLIVGGLALFYYSKRLTDMAGRNRKYIDLIVNQKEGSLDNIAGVCSVSYDKVVKELKYLQTVGVLSNIRLDEANRTVELIEQVISEKPVSINPFGQADTREEVSCKCPGCGATKVLIKGTSAVCEYCDTQIVAN